MTRLRAVTRLRPFMPIIVLASALALPTLYGLTLDPIDTALRNALKPPSAAHLLGTDQLGRDVLARIAHAFLLDIGLATAIVLITLGTGIIAGLLAGEFGGPIDAVLSFLMDIVVSLPQLVVAIVLSTALDGGMSALVVALSLSGWIKYARVIRTETRRLRGAEFIAVARVIGASRPRILMRHVLPNVLPMLSGLIALQFGHTILNIAALGFIGVGVQPPTPEWGSMIAEARPYLGRAPGLALYPGVFLLALTCLSLALARTQWRTAPAAAARSALA